MPESFLLRMLRGTMINTVPAWDSALRVGYDAACDLTFSKTYSRIVCIGMGGSGIAGQLLRAISIHYGFLPIEVVDGPVVPRWYREDALFVLCSYSGNTWEVCAAYDARLQDRIVITSGGELAARAVRDDVPAIILPSGGVPRDMLPFFIGALLGVLAQLSYSTEHIVEALGAHWRACGATMMGGEGIESAVNFIGAAHGCHVWGVRGDTDALAFRVQTQLNENSKMSAVATTLPELHHNLLVGFTAQDTQWPVILLITDAADQRLKIAADSLCQVLDARGVALYKPRLLGDNWLHQVASGLWWADGVSHQIGAARGHARAATVLIDQLKQTFSKKVATHEETTSS